MGYPTGFWSWGYTLSKVYSWRFDAVPNIEVAWGIGAVVIAASNPRPGRTPTGRVPNRGTRPDLCGGQTQSVPGLREMSFRVNKFWGLDL